MNAISTRHRMMRWSVMFPLLIPSLLGFAAGSENSWSPGKTVELIAPSAAGGGTDRTARTIQKILTDGALVRANVVVINKPGAGGTIGWSILNQHQGDGNFLAIGTPNIMTNEITGSASLSYRDLTTIAQLFSEYIVFTVRADSPVATGKDLLDRLKTSPTSLSAGNASSIGGANHIAMALALKAVGADAKKLKAVVFNSGGEAMAALLGGHVDFVPNPGANVASLISSGKVRGLAVSAPERLSGPLAGVPTWREQGFNVIFEQGRGVFGPKGMTKEQVAYWDGVFAMLVQHPDWKADLDRNQWGNTYRNSAAAPALLEAQYSQLKDVLTDLGLAK